MSNLALLMKNNFINVTGINKIKYADEKEKMKAIGMVLLISFSMIMLSIYGFMACFYLSDFLIQINQMELLLILGILGATFTTFFTSLYKASSYLFQSRDYEMLASLPIKQSTILSSKILMLIANNYLFSAAFYINSRHSLFYKNRNRWILSTIFNNFNFSSTINSSSNCIIIGICNY